MKGQLSIGSGGFVDLTFHLILHHVRGFIALVQCRGHWTSEDRPLLLLISWVLLLGVVCTIDGVSAQSRWLQIPLLARVPVMRTA